MVKKFQTNCLTEIEAVDPTLAAIGKDIGKCLEIVGTHIAEGIPQLNAHTTPIARELNEYVIEWANRLKVLQAEKDLSSIKAPLAMHTALMAKYYSNVLGIELK